MYVLYYKDVNQLIFSKILSSKQSNENNENQEITYKLEVESFKIKFENGIIFQIGHRMVLFS